ncbi:MAG: YeeE/YedE thiosulfate transporter family protein [Brachymonas sp.]|nr:YeeE/YedE thiosulfate transporter family protein [Brachymonas sp.]
MKALNFAATLAAGMLFGFGLSLSTMVRPEIVLGFLQLRDWGLLLVMGGAVVVAAVGFFLAPRLLKHPLAAVAFDKTCSSLRRNTIVGAGIFGIGWGICGVCPGPAIAALGVGNWRTLWVLLGIALGALLHGLTADKS